MKKILFTALLFLTMASIQLISCEIGFKILENKKSSYKAGDEFVVKLTVVLTHRNCPEDIGNTKLSSKSLEIMGATKWVETSNGIYERKLKVRISNSSTGNASISAKRTCNKDGGYGSISLAVAK